MSRIYWLVLGLLSIAGRLCAQDNDRNSPAAGKVFELPSHSITQRFRIDLGKGNGLFVELGGMSDVYRLSNIDSFLLVFIGDMKAFHDSLSDPMTTKRIDYVIDAAGGKKIRIRQSKAPDATFLLDKEGPAALKLNQDTINILLLSAAPSGGKGAQVEGIRYDRLGFVINRYEELEGMVNTGLNKKVGLLQHAVANKNPGYHWTERAGASHMDADPSISMANNHAGEGEGQVLGDQLEFFVNVNAQNYKNYFTPSFAVGTSIILNSLGANRHTFSANWEPMFFFSSDAQGHRQTLRNDLLTVSYMERRLNRVNRPVGIPLFLSLGYVVGRQGNIFEKNSFRFSAARLELFHSGVILEPCIFFHDFCRDVTPGIRLSIGGIF